MIAKYLVALFLLENSSVPTPRLDLTHVHNFDFANQASTNDTQIVGASTTSPASITGYRLSGEKSLRPSRIGDDGIHTYIEWTENQALPAVFAVNALGEEEMVDGYMRQDIFTIDRVHERLVFRIGKKLAKAERAVQRVGTANGQ